MTISIPVTNVTTASDLYIAGGFYTDIGSSNWFLYGVNVADVDINFNITSIDVDIEVSANYGFGDTLSINQYIPKGIKQRDFIKSIFTMYNLFAETDKTQPNKLILKHRDDYYDAGTEIDWTEKLAKDRPQNIKFLPELVSKKMLLSY